MGRRSFVGSYRRVPSYAAVVAVLFIGCGESGKNPSDGWQFTSTILPNGTVHAVNVPPAGGGAPTFSLEEEMRIGSIDEEGPSSFGQVKGLAVTRDGRIAVLDAQAQELRVFSSQGEHLTTFGGKGEGPGEMTAGYGLMLAPDGTLWVPDHQTGRMSVYDADRGFLRSYPMKTFSRGFIWTGVMAGDGSILKPSISIAGGTRTDILRVYDQTLTQLDSMPRPAYPEVDPEDPPNSFFVKFGGGGRGYWQVPYYPQRRELLDPRGVIWSTGFGDPSYRIARWEPGGDTTLVVETRRAPVTVTAAERDSVIGGIRRSIEEEGGAPGQDWSKVPEIKPAVLSMFLSEEGSLWVRRPTATRGLEYDVYDRDGRRVGGVATTLPIWDYVAPVIRGDQFWAVVTDELGVAYVVRAGMPPSEPVEGGR